jgi:hypothetical protein
MVEMTRVQIGLRSRWPDHAMKEELSAYETESTGACEILFHSESLRVSQVSTKGSIKDDSRRRSLRIPSKFEWWGVHPIDPLRRMM